MFGGTFTYPDDGSDHSAFAHHAGIPTMQGQLHSFNSDYSVRFSLLLIPIILMFSSSFQAVYHSNYDSFYWFTHFGDPTFEGHVAMARFYGSFPSFIFA